MHLPYGVLLACLCHARTDESVRHPCCVSKPRGRKVCALKQSLEVNHSVARSAQENPIGVSSLGKSDMKPSHWLQRLSDA